MELTQGLGKRWKCINVLNNIPAVWNTKTKVKVECLQEVISEKVTLNHSEFRQGFVADSKLHSVT